MAGLRTRLRMCALAAVVTLGLLLPVALSPSSAWAAEDPDPNPPIDQSCGLDLTLVLDASGSIGSDDKNVRAAADALLSALKNTKSTARVSQFASLSASLAPRTLIDDTSMANGGVLANALQGYNNPRPPRPSNVNLYQYNGGNPQSASSWRLRNESTYTQYTNWDQGLGASGSGGGELTVFVTDGDPTAYDFDQPGDPFRPQDVAVTTDKDQAAQLTIDRAVEEANEIKNGGTRMLAVGVGSALSSNASRDRLIKISGPQVVRDADLAGVDSLNEIDVALVTQFTDLAQFMRSIVLQLCSPSLTVRKLAQTAGNATYQPQQGRDITVTPTVPGGSGFTWILPNTTAATSKTQPTDADGFAQFQWEPIPPEADSTATVAEATNPSYTPGRPGPDNDFRCEARNEAGDVRVVQGDFADPANPQFELDPIEQEIVTCTLYNSFDYDPAIAIEKVNSPTELRGDVPPAQVTSAYEVTNPGNTPLSNVTVTDDRCGPVVPTLNGGFNVGDGNRDNLLDVDEIWQFTCSHAVRLSRSTTQGGRNIVNTATVSGIDPAGTQVTDTATDDVDVFTPAISLTKTVNGEESVTISAGAGVTYEYVVTNTGNTPLGSVELGDDTPPCTSPTRVDDGDGDPLDILDLGESWTYACEAEPTEDVVNTADVTATPLNPQDDNAPFPGSNPAVTDEDVASVTVVNAGLDLTKAVDPDLVLLDPVEDPPAEEVTYTFVATNTGTSPLARPDGTPATDPGWLQDPQCSNDATFEGGDDDGDLLLDPDETWTFTCAGSVDAPTLNVATLTGQPTAEDGAPLPVPTVTDRAAAFVGVRQPGVAVDKTALVPVVLDEGAPAVKGPDTPTPRPAEYRYQVSNIGDVPLSLATTPPADDKCAALNYIEGDTNDDELLDPDEVWVYECTTALDREDADEPAGNQPAAVGNTITVVGVPFFEGALVPDKQATDSDDATVTVIEPSLALTKTASAEVVRNGSTVRYTVSVANTGTSGLQLASLTDDKCALLYTAGDADEDSVLDGADTTSETWTYTCSREINVDSPSDTDTNVATVTGVDELGNSYEDEDDATIRVVEPAISVTKVASADLVPSGTPVTYTFEVRNVGQSDVLAEDALEDVRLVDLSRPPLAAECTTPDLVAKEGGNQDDILEREPAEVWRYECTSPIVRPTANIAVVEAIGGRPIGEEFPVDDYAPARVQPFTPGIAIEKTASPTVVEESGDVTYTYRVTNTGDVPLANVADTITDDTCAPVQYVSGDLDGDGLLDTPRSIFEDSADEAWIFTCTTTIDQDTTNVVVVTGSPSDPGGQPLCGAVAAQAGIAEPCDVRAQDDAHVTVTPPPVSPSPTPAGPGPSEPGTGTASGSLPSTGAPAGLLLLLTLGAVLVVAGSVLLGGSARTRHGGHPPL